MIIEYDENGRITHAISDPVPDGLLEFMLGKSNRVISTDKPCHMNTHYVLDGKIRSRPKCPAIVSVSGNKVQIGRAGGCLVSVIVDGVRMAVAGRTIEFEEPGKSTLIVTPPWPARDGVFEIENQ